MSGRLTAIHLPGCDHPGFADRGRLDPAELIARFREQARRELADARAVLDAADEDFQVTTYVGPYAMRNHRVLQPGKSP